MKKNVLVFPCGSEIGLELYRSLHLSTHIELFGASSVDDHGSFVYENYIGGLPNIDEDSFIERINEVIKENEIDLIFPAHDSVVLRMAQAKRDEDLACDVVTSDASVCEVARSKRTTYDVLKDVIKTPRVFASAEEISQDYFPLFMKPDVGQGSKGVHKVNTSTEADFYLSEDPTLLLLEYLPGKEYTIDCFTDRNGRLLFCSGRERKRVQNGISVSSSRVEDDRFVDIARRINDKLSFNGVWFLQVKEDKNGELTLLEIAPRVAGTMGLERARGINLPLLSIFNALDVPVSIEENKYHIEIDRALDNKYRHDIQYSHVYIDFDDLVVFQKKVNVEVVAFLYQCVNRGVATHLLTRHKEDINESLKRFRLTQLFDEVIWVQDGSPKSSYVSHSDAIFIDDSFAERAEVSKIKNIPVFDGHMIECLMD